MVCLFHDLVPISPSRSVSSLAITYKVHINDMTRANGISGMGLHASLLVRKTLRIPVLSGCSACSEKLEEKQTLQQEWQPTDG